MRGIDIEGILDSVQTGESVESGGPVENWMALRKKGLLGRHKRPGKGRRGVRGVGRAFPGFIPKGGLSAKRGPGGKKITKAKYEEIVKKRAMQRAARENRPGKPTPHDFVVARKKLDQRMRAGGITVVGNHLLGVSDIMGAEFVLGAAKAGSREAKVAIAQTVLAARKGSPRAKKSVRALGFALGRRKRARADKGNWLFRLGPKPLV